MLYQQVPLEKAFAGPHALEQRLGKPIDAKIIAATDPQEFEEVFRAKPALHRFPANLSKRVRAVSQCLVDEYDGDVTAIWAGVDSGTELRERIEAIPGFGEYKAHVHAAVLARQYGVAPDGWDDNLPEWPNIPEVNSEADRVDMNDRKKAWKGAK